MFALAASCRGRGSADLVGMLSLGCLMLFVQCLISSSYVMRIANECTSSILPSDEDDKQARPIRSMPSRIAEPTSHAKKATRRLERYSGSLLANVTVLRTKPLGLVIPCNILFRPFFLLTVLSSFTSRHSLLLLANSCYISFFSSHTSFSHLHSF